ncbi:MAG TPA: hypothetical protein ENN39_09995 [Desulfonatronum sp.]|nr:hypothetical protein [Desulfonatronum sp.]
MSDITMAGLTPEEIDLKIDAVLKELVEDQGDPLNKALQNDIALRSYHVEGLVNEAAQCFPARTVLPARMNRFPLKYFGFLHRIILRGYELLFREQRGVNLALIKALRETMAMNRQLNEQVIAGQQKLALALREQHHMLVELRRRMEGTGPGRVQD